MMVDDTYPPLARTVVSADEWWREHVAREAAAAEERRREFFATRTDIPDLEFLTPDCPVCGTATTFDDGAFMCDGCRITWPRSGYGHEAKRWENES